MTQTFAILASILAFVAVAAGAFGAHALAAHFRNYPDLEPIFRTATQYHLYHALALFAVSWAAERWPGDLIQWSGYLLILGIVLFSGSLYALSLTTQRWLGAITPLGGLAFLAGWICLALGIWRQATPQ